MAGSATPQDPSGLLPDKQWLTSGEVARAFAVDIKTPGRWADAGRLRDVHRTPGGHRRFSRAEIAAHLAGGHQ